MRGLIRSRQFLAMKAVCSGVGSIVAPSRNLRISESRKNQNVRSLRVELDDELLADRQGHVVTRWQLLDAAAHAVLVELDPLRHATAVDGGERLADPRDRLRRLADLDHITRAYQV